MSTTSGDVFNLNGQAVAADLIRVIAERDALREQVARVEALVEDMGCSLLHTDVDVAHNVWCNGATWSRATVEERIRDALTPEPSP